MDKQTNKSDRFWLEKRDLDFPFYNDDNFTRRDFLVLLAGVVLFCIWTMISAAQLFPAIVKMILYFLVITVPFLIAAKGNIKTIIKRPRLYDIVLISIGSFAMFISSIVLALFLVKIGVIVPESAQGNPVVTMEHNTLFYIGLFIQLFGEEMFKISCFLVVLTFIYRRYGKRKTGIILGMFISSILFGILHYSAYGNLLQVILVQGLGAGMIGIYQYLRTKNILVSYASHVLLDLFALASAALLMMI